MAHKQYREYLDHFLKNVLELKSDSPIQKNLIHYDCKHIEDIPDLTYTTDNNELEYLYKGRHNLIQIFIVYFKYQYNDSDPIGNDWVDFTNENSNDLRIMDYCDFSRLHKAGLENTSTTSTT